MPENFTLATPQDVAELERRRSAVTARRWLVPVTLYPLPAPGTIVRCGPAGATWRLLAVDPHDDPLVRVVVVTLEPVLAHDVPPLAHVPELPMPVDVLEPVPAADGDTGTAGDGRGERTVGNTEGIPGHHEPRRSRR